MQVKVKSTEHILKPFSLFQGLYFRGLMVSSIMLSSALCWLIKKFLTADSFILTICLFIGFGVFVIALPYLSNKWTLNRLSHYKLSYENNKILMSGREGWNKIDLSIPITEISRVCVGAPYQAINQLPTGNEGLHHIIKYQISIIMVNGKKHYLTNAIQVFDSDSLDSFFKKLIKAGVSSNYHA